MRLQCSNCNYKFQPRADKVPHKCPYCDKEGGLEKAKTMQDWIDGVATETHERP